VPNFDLSDEDLVQLQKSVHLTPKNSKIFAVHYLQQLLEASKARHEEHLKIKEFYTPEK
jgi:hypothetical protein